MPEALTESFCERCGTRYEFEAPARLSTLRKTRGLVSGLKNYIMSQDALSDTIDDAMRSEEEVIAAHQLEAFHAAFNFCIDCRQYACTNCWNDSAGRCRSCVPIPGVDDLEDRMQAAYLADHQAMHAGAVAEPTEEISRQLGVEAWPQSDLPEVAVTNGHGPMAWPDESLVAQLPPEPEPVAAQGPQEPIAAEAAPEPIAIEPTPELHPILSWEEDGEIIHRAVIEEALPEPEAEWVIVEPEPVAAEGEWVTVEPEPEPVAAEGEWVTVEPAPEPEPVAAEVPEEPLPPPTPVREPQPIRPISETIIRIPRARPGPEPVAPPPVDEEALAARRAQLDVLGIDDPGIGKVAQARNVVPYRSSGAGMSPSELVQRTLGGSSALWDASAREVASARSAVAVQNCGSCGLSLSATARFCRRCGASQARSA